MDFETHTSAPPPPLPFPNPRPIISLADFEMQISFRLKMRK